MKPKTNKTRSLELLPEWPDIMSDGLKLLKQRHGSLSEVAAELGVMQPSLSQYLSASNPKEPGASRAVALINALRREALRQSQAEKKNQ